MIGRSPNERRAMTKTLLATACIALALGGCADDERPAPSPGDGDNNGGDSAGGNWDGTCDPDFGAADACGGDPVGAWTISEACTNWDPASMLTDACPAATITSQSSSLSGTLSLVAGGTYTQNVTSTVDVEVNVPQACVITDCTITGNVVSGATGETVTCVSDGGTGCDCDAAFTDTVDDSGTWSTNDGVATINGGAGTEQFYYCVSGNAMIVRPITLVEEEDIAQVYTR